MPFRGFAFEGPFATLRASHAVGSRCGLRSRDKHDLQTKPRMLDDTNGWAGGISVDVLVFVELASAPNFFSDIDKLASPRATLQTSQTAHMSVNGDASSAAGFDSSDHQVGHKG